jgi:uncharacterized protein YutD
MNDTKDKKELSKEIDSVLSDIQTIEEPQEPKRKKLWQPEEVIMSDEKHLSVGGREYRLIYNHRDGFDMEKLAERFSEVLYRYDYVVGDWGYDQLRLKGFFNATHKKALPEQRIDTLEDYLYEFCNFGCAFFILERVGRNNDKFEVKKPFDEDQAKNRKRKKKTTRPKNKAYIDEKKETISTKPKRSNKPAFKKKTTTSKTATQVAQTSEKKRNFTIRQKN